MEHTLIVKLWPVDLASEGDVMPCIRMGMGASCCHWHIHNNTKIWTVPNCSINCCWASLQVSLCMPFYMTTNSYRYMFWTDAQLSPLVNRLPIIFLHCLSAKATWFIVYACNSTPFGSKTHIKPNGPSLCMRRRDLFCIAFHVHVSTTALKLQVTLTLRDLLAGGPQKITVLFMHAIF